MRIISLTSKTLARVSITLTARKIGRDLLLEITGGSVHIGAVALAEPDHPPCICQAQYHREGQLAGEIAAMLAQVLGLRVAVIAGIHYDCASAEEIEAAVFLARKMATDLLKQLGKGEDYADDQTTG